MEALKPRRHKVTTACDPCRRRKIKCDGCQPVCEPCKKRPRSDTACTWGTGSVRGAHTPADYIRRLEDRIRLLEERDRHGHLTRPNNSGSMNGALEESVPQTTSRHAVTCPNSPEPNIRQSIASIPWVGSSFTSTPGTSTNLQQPNSAAFTVPGIVPPLREASGSTETIFLSHNHSAHDIVEDDNHSGGLVGSPSARIFMQEVEKMVTQKLDGASQPTPRVLGRGHDNPSPLVPGRELRQRDLDCALPPREQADSLITSYWSYVHVLYPFLDKSQIEEDYDKIWDRGDSVSDKQSFLCLLNTIFAIGSRLVRSATPDHEHSAATFCLRARELLDIEICSVRSVQSYLLLAQYFHSTDESHMCWMFVGLATRTAQILGLHLFETSERESEIRTREIFRKVWHGCILMDREVSMLYGRPCMIDPKTAAAVPLPLVMDEGNLQLGHVQLHTVQAQQTPAVGYHVFSLGLYDILYDIHLNFYSSESQSHSRNGRYDTYFKYFSAFESNASIFELQGRLSRWENDVPDYLKVRDHPQENATNDVLVRRAVILHQRYLHVYLLLLRPILSDFLSSEFRNNGEFIAFGNLLFHRISLQCTIGCVKIAQEAIDTIYVGEAAGSGEMGSLSAWWYNVIFLYTSATVLIAGRLSPSVMAEVSEESILDGFRKAVAVLDEYTIFSTSIHRLIAVLRILFEIIPQQYSRLKQASQQVESYTELATSDNTINAATFQYWCPLRPTRRLSSLHDPRVHSTSEYNNPTPPQFHPNFDLVFDPDDFTWLMKMPFGG